VLEGFARMAGSINENIRQLFGVRLDRNEEFSWLVFDTTPAALAGSVTDSPFTMTVGQEADFVATAVVAYVATTAAPTTPTPNILRFSIRDGSTGRDFSRQSLHISFLGETVGGASAGSRPLFLTKPRIFSRNSQVTWRLTNLTATPSNVDIAFFGYKVFDVDALDLTKIR
jgi:hypothetical protein